MDLTSDGKALQDRLNLWLTFPDASGVQSLGYVQNKD